ncbi:hypothetical protein ACWEOW_00970 [Monashia sp. NPDC004114]
MSKRLPPPRTLGPDAELPLQYPLSAHEADDAWYVVVEGRADDWLARFEKAPGFDAREWATSMAHTFNIRLRAQIEHDE